MKVVVSENKVALNFKVQYYEETPDQIMEAPLSEPVFTKIFTRPDGFMLYDIIRVDFFSTFNFLYPDKKK